MKPLRERFDNKWTGEPNSGCWLWTGDANEAGYGRIKDDNRREYRAHRVSWELHNGPIPDGLWALHKCDTPLCVNPRHLFLGTHNDNVKDRDRKGRVQHGAKHYNCRITDDQVREIRASSDGISELAARYGVRYSHIIDIRSGRRRARAA